MRKETRRRERENVRKEEFVEVVVTSQLRHASTARLPYRLKDTTLFLKQE